MTVSSHRLELLSPARDAAIAREAILHGADAVYIGGPGFGARHNASNSLKDIAELVPFAHRYGAKIFVTLNTILHDDELEPAQRLITDLYQTGVDALIVQDMGILELDIPPIELHGTTKQTCEQIENACNGSGQPTLIFIRMRFRALANSRGDCRNTDGINAERGKNQCQQSSKYN